MSGGATTQPGEPGWPGATEALLPDHELDTVPDLSGSHQAHLFDYCRALLGQEAEAARTARCDLDSADALRHDPVQLRAWLFEVARRQALAIRPPGSREPSYLPHALIAASGGPADGVWRVLRALTDRDREILDLVYRHDIRPADLSGVLGIPAEEAYRRLVNAEEEFLNLAAGQGAHPGAGLEDIAALPLAVLLAAEGERQLGQRPVRWFAGTALWRSVARRRVQLAAAALIPIAAIIGTVVYFAASGHPAASHDAGVLPASRANQASQGAGTPREPHAGQFAQSKRGSPPGQPAYLFVPVASPTATAVPSPTPSPSGTATASPPGPNPPPPPSPKPKSSPP
ncbi:MAG TPA: sigma-70 family RNA polymerase sigma factor [Streptosporangiaceae bacterium]|jgi:DNA-directed RNA polymerase specialized sigma24 family protein